MAKKIVKREDYFKILDEVTAPQSNRLSRTQAFSNRLKTITNTKKGQQASP